jgi:glycosyltransferase involved in cell wall biosynthesis
MYLPINVNPEKQVHAAPVFYGAINVYLKQLFPFWRKMPLWVEKALDSMPMLKLAARLSGSTNARGLEDMTISMLMGEDGKQSSELDHLIHWLKHEEKPDVVHLSNALLLGLAKRLKQELGCLVICSLQDEHQWIDPMHVDHRNKIWDLMAEKAKYVDGFITVSHFYSGFMQKNMNLGSDRIQVVPLGIDVTDYQQAAMAPRTPVIGYLNRMSEMFGLETLVDAFILLRRRFRDLELHLTGGYTAEDKIFLKRINKKIKRARLEHAVVRHPEFDREERIRFLQSLSVLSVPVPYGEAFGTYLVEALACGVPAVQPRVAAFPEFIEHTGGGVLYEPNGARALADKLTEILSDQEKAREMGRRGREVVLKEYTIQEMSKNMVKAYQNLMD